MKDKVSMVKAIGSVLLGLGTLISAILGVVKWVQLRKDRASRLAAGIQVDTSDMNWNFPDEKKFYY
jgi:hypothetical protein